MKESRSAAVYVLAFVSALHLATFSAITVYQFRRINYLERILTQPNVSMLCLVRYIIIILQLWTNEDLDKKV